MFLVAQIVAAVAQDRLLVFIAELLADFARNAHHQRPRFDDIFSGIRVPAAMIEPAPMRAPFRMIDTHTDQAAVFDDAAVKVTECPTVTQSPTVTGH